LLRRRRRIREFDGTDPRTEEIRIPSAPVSISDEISGEEVNGVFAEVNSQKSSLF
jgi:hypothetical protein